ncbi:MAG TPA: hypothetical protein VK100_08430 [Pseudogracilibacillus sp.]|nr:hypothetical protein [Pseudogracilibacillus sp.]
MSEQNKNRNKDKGKQKNIAKKYDTRAKYEAETASENQFSNGQSKVNKPKRNDKNQYH